MAPTSLRVKPQVLPQPIRPGLLCCHLPALTSSHSLLGSLATVFLMENTRHGVTSGPLHRLLPLPGALLPRELDNLTARSLLSFMFLPKHSLTNPPTPHPHVINVILPIFPTFSVLCSPSPSPHHEIYLLNLFTVCPPPPLDCHPGGQDFGPFVSL